MKPLFPSIAAPQQNLARLVIIRWVLLAAVAAGAWVGRSYLDLSLPVRAMAIIMGVIALVNLGTWVRLRKGWSVTSLEFFLQILLDILGVSFLFYYTGGAGNPFVFYYLVPLSISSATLPWRYTGALALLSVGCYSLLLFYHVPIPAISPAAMSMEGDTHLNPHILGMWFNFIISAGLITFFVVKMSQALKQQQQQLNEHREESLRDEQVLAVATLAAGTAHELGSPLTTMKLLLNEIQHDYSGDPGLDRDINILQQQVELCSSTLQDLVQRAERNQETGAEVVTARYFCDKIIERWRLLRPEVNYQMDIQSEAPDQLVSFHSSVEQAIINLLNNAADACRREVGVSMSWTPESLTIEITDDGEGVPEPIKQQLGQPFVTTKGRGLGLGLFLSNATIARYGGTLTLVDREAGGTELTIWLPLNHHD